MAHDAGVVEHVGAVRAISRVRAGGLAGHLAGRRGGEGVRYAEVRDDRGGAARPEDLECVTPR